MSKKKIISETMDTEKAKNKKTVGKKDEIKKLMEDLANFSEPVIPSEKDIGTSVEASEKVSIEKVKKLKCDYKVFKSERNIAKMRVPDKCEICGKSFKENDDIYVAWDKKMKEMFICKDCAEKE